MRSSGVGLENTREFSSDREILTNRDKNTTGLDRF